jgi:tetratricopeptide (TPR) repeat protein
MHSSLSTNTPPITHVSYPSSPGSSSGPSLRGLIDELINIPAQSTIERHSCEERIQQCLNNGQKPSEDDLTALQTGGYSISYNAATLERFKNFSLANHLELSQTIQAATEATGILVNRYNMYQPGPASLKSVSGAARGFEEINAVHQNQNAWKDTVSETIACYLQTLIKHMPVDRRWSGLINLLYLNGGTDSLLTNLGIDLPQCMPEHAWNMLNINIKPKSLPPFLQESFPHHSIQSGSETPIQELFYPAPPRPQDQAHVIIVSALDIARDQMPHFVARLNQWRAKNSLVIFIEDTHESDDHEIACRHPSFMRSRNCEQTKGEILEETMKQNGYQINDVIEESLLEFPLITSEIREEILSIKEGDYENPYTHASEDFITVKALMEHIAGFPLEALTREERWQYLEALENKFNLYEGSFLKNFHRIFFACPEDSESFFKQSFISMVEKELNPTVIYTRAVKLIESRYFKAAELSLVQALQKCHKEWESLRLNDNLQSVLLVCREFIEGLDRLGEVYINQGLYPEAAALFCYAKQVEMNYGQNHPSLLLHFETQIETVESALLTDRKDIEVIIGGMEQAKSNQAKLKAIREENKAKFEVIKNQNLSSEEMAAALRPLNQELAMQMKRFLSELIDDAIELMEQVKGLPPCEFAVIALGSLNEEMTPYSKFELSIVLQNEQNIDYFIDLATYLHVEIIKLEESPLSEFNIRRLSWLSDDITPRGFRFGQYSYTSSQRPLIHNVKKLARHLHQTKNELWALERIHLPTLLSNVVFVTGSPEGETLVTEFETLVQTNLTPEMRQERALILMEDDLQPFTLDFEEETVGKFDQLNNDLSRFMNTMMNGLADYYNLKSRTSWGRVEELQERGVLTPGGAQDLKELLMLGQELRLSLCFSYGQHQAKDIEDNKVVISPLYYRLIPFWQAMTKFYALANADENPVGALQQERFYNDSFYIKGVIANRFNDLLAAEGALEQETEKTPESLELLGDVKFILAQYTDALEHFREALTFHLESPLLQARLHTKIGSILKQQAKIQDDETGAAAAYFQAETILKSALEEKENRLSALKEQVSLPGEGLSSLQSSSSSSSVHMPDESIRKQIKTLEKEISAHQKMLEVTYRLQSHLQLNREEFSKAKEYLEFAKSLTKKRTRSKPKDPLSQLIVDHSAAENPQLEAKIAYEENRNYPLAQTASEEARKILISIYRRPDHPKVLIHEAIATAYHLIPQLDKQKKLIIQLERAFGQFHPAIISAYGRLSFIYSSLGLEKNAVEALIKQSVYAEGYYGVSHPVVADVYYHLGNNLNHLDQLEKAKNHHVKALEIRLKIFGESHPDVAMSYNNLGFTEADLGDKATALAHQKLALKIFQEIYGNNHTTIGNILSNISITLKQLERFKESLQFERQVLDWQVAKYGEDHSNAIRHRNNLANALTNVGYHQKAVKLLKKMLESRGDLTEDHPLLPTIYNNLETALSRSGQFKEALSYLEKEVELRKKRGEEGQKVKNSSKEIALLNAIVSSMTNLRRKRYGQVFTMLDSIIREHRAYTPDSICFLLYTSILSKKTKQMEWHEANIKDWVINPKIPTMERGKIALALLQYYLKQKKFNEAARCALILKNIDPGMLVTYRLIETEGLKEQSDMVRKQVSLSVLGELYWGKVLEAREASNKQKTSSASASSSSSSSKQSFSPKKMIKRR